MTLKVQAQATKEKNRKLHFIKIEIFVIQRTLKKVKRQAMEWDKILANHKSDMGFVSNFYKEL